MWRRTEDQASSSNPYIKYKQTLKGFRLTDFKGTARFRQLLVSALNLPHRCKMTVIYLGLFLKLRIGIYHRLLNLLNQLKFC